MGISRRGFLQAILATAVAPAVVRAASLMKVVPISDSGIVGIDYTLDNLEYGPRIYHGPDMGGDFTVEMWTKGPQALNTRYDPNTWHHIAQVKTSDGKVTSYIDGARVSDLELMKFDGFVTRDPPGPDQRLRVGGAAQPAFNGSVGDIKVTKGVARYESDFKPPIEAPNFGFSDSALKEPNVRSMSFSPLRLPAVPAILTDSADVTLSKFQKAFFGRAISDVARINNKAGQLIDKWEQPLITTCFDKKENV